MRKNCQNALNLSGGNIDEVYHFAADMGGIGHITYAEADILRNNALMDINMVYTAALQDVERYFFSSSVCVYRDMEIGEQALSEDDAIPAFPNNEYGWEKLYGERVTQAHGSEHNMIVRIARSQNTYGIDNPWIGGREKAPAAICRKVAQAEDGGQIDVWGDGSAIRAYTFADDAIDGIYQLMHSDLEGPVNLGTSEYVSVKELVETVINVSGKNLSINYVDGPVGVQSRNFTNDRMSSIGWKPEYSLREGISVLYPWIEERVKELQDA